MMGIPWRDRDLPKDLDWNKTALVLVNGTTPNFCGHVLLYVGGGMGHYFHFNGPTLWDYPRFMQSHGEYDLFLSTEKKRELIRRFTPIPHPDKAEKRLHELLNNKWFSVLVAHNCATFAGEVLRAGGNFFDVPDKCPVLDMASFEFWEMVFGPLRQKFGTQKQYEAHYLH